MSNTRFPHPCAMALLAVGAGLASLGAQAQNVKPPRAQLWMDVSTGSMAGMPEMDLPAGMGGVLGGMMGGGGRGGASTSYGMARGPNIMPPRVLDIAFYNSRKPGAEAVQAIPPGMRMGESLPLLPPPPQARAPREREPSEVPQEVERPKGKILIYWGCGEAVRAGQPRVIDLARAGAAEFGTAFAGRHAPDRGARVGPQHVLYPNERNTVMLARDSSLVGEHQVRGEGVPTSMKFTLAEAQNVMPAIQLQSQGQLQDSVALSWAPVPNARAYYLHAMTQRGDDMVMWSSAETPDTGMGLFDYLPNATIDRWTRERVLLGADATRCAVPKGIFAPAAGGRGESTPMLRMMAYGSESNFAYPPRPADPKAAWEPEWAVRVRVKSHTMAMLGQEQGEGSAARGSRRARPEQAAAPEGVQPPPEQQQQGSEQAPLPINPGAILRGIFGR
ncbi:hypothetical protein [Ramlibacter sp.]|uniref:hypothetical protein n=1 Tax=Ramlibacter sp. TaxID=1917967 RepID=UPI002BC96351|nr:hypothetical protein [Ramlibacter sp.]HWI84076.1 hypothetical protein [Ramlibacter sp.]